MCSKKLIYVIDMIQGCEIAVFEKYCVVIMLFVSKSNVPGRRPGCSPSFLSKFGRINFDPKIAINTRVDACSTVLGRRLGGEVAGHFP